MASIRRGPELRSSVRLRATLAATLVVALALGLSAFVLIAALRGSLHDGASLEAARRAEAAVPKAPTGLPERTPATDTPGTGQATVAEESYPESITIVDPDVRVLRTGSKVDDVSLTTWGLEGEYVVRSAAAGAVMVQARISLAPAQQALNTLYWILLPGIPALLLLVAGMTWFAVGRALAPVSAIRAKVAEITTNDLHQRVPVPESRDEIAALARTVNTTLDRLESAVGRHKRFVADAAHELRSPIATLRTRLELAAPPARPHPEPPAPSSGSAAELAREALVDVERLQALTTDLLLLARLDAAEPIPAEELDLGQVAAEEALRVRHRPDVKVRLDIAPDILVQGSTGHLARLIVNLVDNAVRHASTTVDVRVSADDRFAVLDVRDDGPGIPREHREAVFRRFTRLDEARARDEGGSGLGLAIARDITLLHGGTLTVTDREPGACLQARLPLAAISGGE